MKNIVLLAVAFMCFSTLNAQTNEAVFNTAFGLVMTTIYGSDHLEINDLMSFKGIDFMTVNFSGKSLKDKATTSPLKIFGMVKWFQIPLFLIVKL